LPSTELDPGLHHQSMQRLHTAAAGWDQEGLTGVAKPWKGKPVAALELQHPLPSCSSLPHTLETCSRAQLL